jgi:hypothetical protein
MPGTSLPELKPKNNPLLKGNLSRDKLKNFLDDLAG